MWAACGTDFVSGERAAGGGVGLKRSARGVEDLESGGVVAAAWRLRGGAASGISDSALRGCGASFRVGSVGRVSLCGDNGVRNDPIVDALDVAGGPHCGLQDLGIAGNKQVMAAPQQDPDDVTRAGAFEPLFREHYRPVLAYVRRRAASEDVDDVVADTFLVAWRRIERVPRDSPLPWLLAVARKTIATQRRGAARRDALHSRLQSSIGGEAESSSLGEPSTGAVAAALARLGPKDREALTLIGWDGLRPRDAAAVMGEVPSAFYVRLHRAKRRLRRLLDEAAEEPSNSRFAHALETKEPIP